MKLKNLLVLAVPAFFWVACSSDTDGAPSEPSVVNEASSDSSGENLLPPTQESSSSSESLNSVDNPSNPLPESSSSDEVALSSEAAPSEPDVPFVPEELVYDSIGFVDIGNAFRTVAPDEKVVFVLRHAEREMETEKETPLTSDGVMQAQSVGQKLISADEFVFAHTDYVRTEETAHNIALGRGQASFVHDTVAALTSGWFIKDAELRDSYIKKDTNTNVIVSLWAYDGMFADAFYDLEKRSLEVINTYLIKDYAEMPKVKVVISHDEFLVPLVAWATNKTATIYPRKRGHWWINYLAGLAIIVNSKNEIRYIGVKGLESAVK